VDLLMTWVESAALWSAALGSGTMAGVYFAFSAFIMRSLAVLPPPAAIAAMQSINRVILSSAFLPLFFATTAISLGLAVGAVVRWGAPGSMPVLVGSCLYVVGMFGLTAAFNVPLNDALEAVDPSAAAAADTWSRYQQAWTRWNHIRTVASIAACALFVVAITARVRG
jgi:uncharacterized membrane protein